MSNKINKMAGGRPNVGDGEAKSKRLKPYYFWNFSTNRIMSEEVESGLVKTLEEAGLKRGLLRRTKFRGDGVKVKFEYDKGTIVRMKVDLYADSVEKGERMRELIQKQIDSDNERFYIRGSSHEKYATF